MFINIVSYLVLFFFLPLFHYSITSILSFICPPVTIPPAQIHLLLLVVPNEGLHFWLVVVIPLGEQIAEQGHVLNAVPGQWLAATSQFGIRAFFDKSQGQYKSPHWTVPNGLKGSCEIHLSGKGQDVVMNTNVIECVE
jgi:hypothetical protein